MSNASSDLIARVEQERRAGNYPAMYALGVQALHALGYRNISPGEKRLRAKVYYEFHMGEYEQKSYDQSLIWARLSAADALEGGDAVGVLFTRQNIGGLLLPAIGNWQDGVSMHIETLHMVDALLQNTTEADIPRLHRVAMNCCAHLIDMLVDNGGEKAAVAGYVDRLEQNPIYVELYQNSDWGPACLKKARDYANKP